MPPRAARKRRWVAYVFRGGLQQSPAGIVAAGVGVPPCLHAASVDRVLDIGMLPGQIVSVPLNSAEYNESEALVICESARIASRGPYSSALRCVTVGSRAVDHAEMALKSGDHGCATFHQHAPVGSTHRRNP